MASEGQNPAQAGIRAMQDAVGGAVAAQQRSVNLAQNWAESVSETYRDQAESYRALTDAVTTSLNGLEQTLKSQEETNRALRESLDAYRNLIENASETQERNVQLVQSFFDDIVTTLRDQVEGARSLLLEPAQRQQEFFQNVTQEWLDAYVRLLNAPLDLYRASTGGASGTSRGGGAGEQGRQG